MHENKEARDFMRQLAFIAIGILVGLFMGVASSALFEILKGNHEKKIFIIFIFGLFASMFFIKRFAWLFINRKKSYQNNWVRWFSVEWKSSKIEFLFFVIGPWIAFIWLIKEMIKK